MWAAVENRPGGVPRGHAAGRCRTDRARPRRRRPARERRRPQRAAVRRRRTAVRRSGLVFRSAQREFDAQLGAAHRAAARAAQADRSADAGALRPGGRSRRAAESLRIAARPRARYGSAPRSASRRSASPSAPAAIDADAQARLRSLGYVVASVDAEADLHGERRSEAAGPSECGARRCRGDVVARGRRSRD